MFLWRMEDVLSVYQLPYDPLRPVICYDERPCLLIGDQILPLPIQPGKPKREDYHYERNGVANLLIAYEPLTGRRYAQITRNLASQSIVPIVWPRAVTWEWLR